jgi:hypothetical protein
VCHKCREPRLRAANCWACGREFQAQRRGAEWTECCSKSCAQWRRVHPDSPGGRTEFIPGDRAARRRALANAKARARRLRHAQTWDGITDAEIWDRDGWRCQIPGCASRQISRKLKYPAARSASVDHIVPLSQGGDDTARNKRAAHLGCNLRRRDVAQGDQLLLFGSVRESSWVPLVMGKERPLCACGAEVAPGRRAYCQGCIDARAQKKDRPKILSPRPCVHCGKTFIAQWARFCSVNCQSLAYYYAHREEVLARIAAKKREAPAA